MIHGSEGTDELFQLRVCLKTGKAHADTLPQDGEFHFDDDKDEALQDRTTPMERLALLAQYNMDRQNLPSQLE